MNILLLSRYTRMGASSRLRAMQYLPALKSAGFTVHVAPFFDDAYLHALYSGQRVKGSKLGYVCQRIRQMRTHPQPDLIWLEYEALPWVPWMIERSFLPRGVPIVSDYDDAVFHRYDKNRRGTVRSILGDKIGQVMAASALVMAGNRYIANYAERFEAPRLATVPTVVDLDLYTVDPKARNTDDLRVGWIGTPETWQAFANPIHHVLDQILAEHRAQFRAIGAGMQPATSGTLEILSWTEETEVSLIQSMDIGVMPLPNTDWARGKCGYKLIQYMACGLPVVASPVGVNREIVEHGVNGFLAETDAEWRSAIETLLADGELRRRMGAAGRRKVEEHYSLQVWGPRVAQMLRSVADQGRRA